MSLKTDALVSALWRVNKKDWGVSEKQYLAVIQKINEDGKTVKLLWNQRREKDDKIMISSNGVTIKGYIDEIYDIPEDSILKIKSDGIFGKKKLFIEAGFGK